MMEQVAKEKQERVEPVGIDFVSTWGTSNHIQQIKTIGKKIAPVKISDKSFRVSSTFDYDTGAPFCL